MYVRRRGAAASSDRLGRGLLRTGTRAFRVCLHSVGVCACPDAGDRRSCVPIRVRRVPSL